MQGGKPGTSTLSAEGKSLRSGASKASLIVSAATLETLPIELQVLILASAPDFATLRDLVHASPVYHRAYTSAKAIILSALIQTQQVPGTEVDSLGVLLSLDYADGMQDHPAEVIAFLDRYRHARGRGRWVNTKNPPLPVRWRPLQTDIDDLIVVVKSQNFTEYLTDQFLEMEVQNRRCGSIKAGGKITISSEERLRNHRAIYRLQIYYNLFGIAESTSLMQTDNIFQCPSPSREIWALFFQTFPPWEHQEMYTMWKFVTLRAETIIATLIADPKKDVWNMIPKSQRYELAVRSITCAGPLFLAKAIRKKSSEEQYCLVTDNFECLLRSRPDLISIPSSIDYVYMAVGRPSACHTFPGMTDPAQVAGGIYGPRQTG
ncbi:hypothetical protein O988_01336 [Pseudogymnoascus sp. VKM F-3808]|nr:hypothetical protein O988_01336 [Pseudogymnoascus sp. VKM F-3808]